MRTIGNPASPLRFGEGAEGRGQVARVALTVILATVSFVPAQSALAEVSIPVVGQPSPFYGAAGKKVKIEATATPTELTLDDSIFLTLRIEGLLNAAEVERPKLADIELYSRDFQIEDEPNLANEAADTRVFRYRLRPRGMKIQSIPEFVFPYYDPGITQPPDRPELPFRKVRTTAISISIRKAAIPPRAIVPLEVPAFAKSLAPTAIRIPSWTIWLGFFAPPFLAVGWCIIWRLMNPEGVRLARRQRSRAARSALRALQLLTRSTTASPVDVVRCATNYLTHRYHLSGVFRTSGELSQHLREARAGETIIAESEAFLRSADATRFAPNSSPISDTLMADAERLIRLAEGDA